MAWNEEQRIIAKDLENLWVEFWKLKDQNQLLIDAVLRSVERYDDGRTSIEISDSTSELQIDPAALIDHLDLTFPAAPRDGKRIGIFFGGTLDPWSDVVTNLTFSGGTFYQQSTPTSAKAGDYLEYQFNQLINKWTRLK